VTRKSLNHPDLRPSLKASTRDGIAYSIMAGAGETYFAAFALFLKASITQVGWMSSLPAVIGSFAQLFSAWLGRHYGRRRGIIVTGAYLQALAWIPLFAVPILFPDDAITLLIVTVTCYYALGNLIIPQWSSLMGDLLPERWRGRYFARRNGVMSITNFIALVTGGAILHFSELAGLTYLGFVVIFSIALAARLVSAHYLARMEDPAGHVARLEWPPGVDWLRRIRGSRFLHFAVFFSAMQFAVGIAAPYFAVYMLRDLNLSYLEYTALTAASILTQFLTLNGWGRISDAFGNRLILVATGVVIPILPSLWLLSENFWYLLAVQFIAGGAWGGFSLSAGNFLYDLVPAEKRVTYLAVHNVMAAVGIFCGALLGSLIAVLSEDGVLPGATHFSHALFVVFVVSTLARLVVAALFLPRLKEVRTIRPVTAVGLVLRATRSMALAGFVVEFAGLRKRKRET